MFFVFSIGCPVFSVFTRYVSGVFDFSAAHFVFSVFARGVVGFFWFMSAVFRPRSRADGRTRGGFT